MGNTIIGVARDSIIKRYMSLDKFEKLVNSEAMYFSRFDSFEDNLEGGINNANFPSISNSLKIFDAAIQFLPGTHKNDNPKNLNIIAEINSETFPSLFGTQRKIDGDAFLQRVSSWLYASCWTDLPHECQAMWQLYGSSGSNCRHINGCAECEKTQGMSVCIESTVGAVLDSLEMKENYNLSIQKIEYIDHQHTVFEDQDLLSRPFFSKAKHFSYENEVRFLLWPDRKDINFSYKYQQSSTNDIQNVELRIKNMNSFIGKIILSPLPFKKTNIIHNYHMEKHQSTLGLQESLSNEHLRSKIKQLCDQKNINVEIFDSDLNQTLPIDCYTYKDNIHHP
ncbi:hypothetical protein [Pseudomonas sp. GL-RE-26]|uniref:hypothetical protein n=1 Tax=Pseudomonas sp. GL-RE-26 TaxID=2832390 RepID=UPI001CC14642|nr:hypothetical protein [Pseudomonas sp. GL-RE-26]